jgi:NAD(P)-dependent dehydrogenase (short-subunit alcohol dehydrogenase family)
VAGLLAGKVAVITGGSSGLGRAMAQRFADEGVAGLVIADLRAEPREGGPTTVDLVSDRTRAMFVATDVTVPEQIERAVAAAADLGPLDVMVNNAGIVFPNKVLATDEAAFDRMNAVNVKGVFFGTQYAARAMLAAGRQGSIINISSMAGLQGVAGMSLYCLTKGAVRTFTYAAAAELAPKGIRVNAIHPGMADTTMIRDDIRLLDEDGNSRFPIPIGRLAQPGDIAGAAVYLASDLASYVVGSSLTVDGGMTVIG